MGVRLMLEDKRPVRITGPRGYSKSVLPKPNFIFVSGNKDILNLSVSTRRFFVLSL